MKNKYFILLAGLFGLIGLFNQAEAQTLPVGTPVLEDAYRRAQLIGEVDSSISFTSRPFFPSEALNLKDGFDPDSSLSSERLLPFTGVYRPANKSIKIQILPFSWQQQYNNKAPYGWNDGGMIPARGYQTMVSGGVYLKYGPLSIQLRPELVYAENKAFRGFAQDKSDGDLQAFYAYNNMTDIPERFGNSSYSKLLWGQSSIRLTFGPVSFGLSNENLWWGPGLRNSLLMSNNAQGFKHLTLNTVKPIRTPIGSFEGQIIAGRLEQSGLSPLATTQNSLGQNLYTPKDPDWRYQSAFVFTYQPKWVPGLFLGMTRSFQIYHEDLGSGFNDYFPLFSPFEKINTVDEDLKRRDQLTSVFSRWVFKKAKAELYFEYGLNDHSLNLRDFIMSPEHSRAYIFGMRKLVPIKKYKGEFIQVSAEVTQLQQSIDRVVRDAAAWYLHYQVTPGYTHKGQVLGAGIGPGSNLQSVDFSWIRGLKVIGLQLERFVHNNDLYNIFSNTNQGQRKWIDLSAAAHADWNYKNVLLSAKLNVIRSLNYQWYTRYEPTIFYIPDYDTWNVQGQLGISYRF